ncbi:TAXI family TRAP transporter solute-binding subunit [Magnetovibrio sp. PR-2]|uniref:TAXI family TRAP transporter solute-binding subunit n=1 Tax=Magnetovibrio sp. PR-2 TaxID=3120356 RepID=UPI002FCE5213
MNRILKSALMWTPWVVALVVIPVTFSSAQSPSRYISIGTGGVTGVYYPAGGGICRLLNKGRRNHGIRCSVESTQGSAFNVDEIRNGIFDFGIVQSDVHYNAVQGQGHFTDAGPMGTLRSVLALHAEPFTIVSRSDANITTLDELKGKRVNIGNPGSGQRSTMEMVMGEKGWSVSDFSKTAELASSEQSKALCDNHIDAMVFTVGHPNASIKEATISCDTNLVNLAKGDVTKITEKHPYLFAATIPGGMYRGTQKDTRTFGVGATVVTSSTTPDYIVYELVKSVFEKIEDFRLLHPAFKHLDPKQMTSQGLSAPLHPGAEAYFKEVGLLP